MMWCVRTKKGSVWDTNSSLEFNSFKFRVGVICSALLSQKHHVKPTVAGLILEFLVKSASLDF